MCQLHRRTNYINFVAVVGKSLWRPSGPARLLRKGHVEQSAQDHTGTSFEYL